MRCSQIIGAVATLVLLISPTRANPVASVSDQLAAARRAGKPAFLLVTQPRARGLVGMRQAVQAARARAPHVAYVEMDRSAAANRSIVRQYGLAGTRVPMVLVLAHNGAPGGGVLAGPKATQRMLALLPSPRKADTLLALFERKAAFVVVGRPEMPNRAAVLAACRRATGELEGMAAVIEVDLLDEYEQGFLDVLGADRSAKGTSVHVFGFSGRKTEVLKGAVASPALVKAAKKKAECCPGGKCG